MTKAEAIKELKLMLTDNSNTGDMYNALKMAIEALSNTPNTLDALECVKLNNNSTKVDNKNVDLINRQDAIDIIDMDKMKPEIAPSLGSTAERDFKIYNQSCNKHIELIKQLPSAQPEQRNGKWIDDTCTECGYGVQPWNNTPFCPRCGSYNGGADMRGEQNE